VRKKWRKKEDNCIDIKKERRREESS